MFFCLKNFEQIYIKEKEYLSKRENILKKSLHCILCDVRPETPEQFLHHIDKDKNHSVKMRELLEETFIE